MTQKRILRAKARGTARERDLLLRDAFRASWADIDNPDTVNVISQLVQADPDLTALQLFAMVNRSIEEILEVTGESRDVVLARLQRD